MGTLKGAMHVGMSIIASSIVGILVAVICMRDWPGYLVTALLSIVLVFGHDYDE